MKRNLWILALTGLACVFLFSACVPVDQAPSSTFTSGHPLETTQPGQVAFLCDGGQLEYWSVGWETQSGTREGLLTGLIDVDGNPVDITPFIAEEYGYSVCWCSENIGADPVSWCANSPYCEPFAYPVRVGYFEPTIGDFGTGTFCLYRDGDNPICLDPNFYEHDGVNVVGFWGQPTLRIECGDIPVSSCTADWECQWDNDIQLCDPGLGVCVPGCDNDQMCLDALGDGYICEAGQCIEGCHNDPQCLYADQVCLEAELRCVDCTVHGECPPETPWCVPGEYVCAECVDNDDECLGELICVERMCVEGCRVHADCDWGFICDIPLGQDWGLCVPGCLTDGDCDAGLVCDNALTGEETGECIPGCYTDQDCLDPMTWCDWPGGEPFGQCMPGCAEDLDCPGGFCDLMTHTCIDCWVTEDCPPGEICEDNFCVPGCRDDGDCVLIGQICVEGDCIFGCRQDVDCPADQWCNLFMGLDYGFCIEGCRTDPDNCLEGVCDPDTRTCVDCLVDADCPDGVCYFDPVLETRSCVDCRVNEDCELGFVCDLEFLQCVPGCVDRGGECPPGFVCDPVLDRCVGCVDNDDCAGRPEGEYCLLSLQICVECLNDSHCPPGEECLSNACEPVSEPDGGVEDGGLDGGVVEPDAGLGEDVPSNPEAGLGEDVPVIEEDVPVNQTDLPVGADVTPGNLPDGVIYNDTVCDGDPALTITYNAAQSRVEIVGGCANLWGGALWWGAGAVEWTACADHGGVWACDLPVAAHNLFVIGEAPNDGTYLGMDECFLMGSDCSLDSQCQGAGAYPEANWCESTGQCLECWPTGLHVQSNHPTADITMVNLDLVVVSDSPEPKGHALRLR